MKQHISHFFEAASYTIKGLKATYKNEIAFRQEVAVLIIILPIVFSLDLPFFQKTLLLGSWLLVMVVELLNTGIESAIDRISLDRHELSGQAKDQGSAAVAVAMLIAVLVWLGVLL